MFSETTKRVAMFIVAVAAIGAVAFWSLTSGNNDPEPAAAPNFTTNPAPSATPSTSPEPSPSMSINTEPKETAEEIAAEYATYDENAIKYLRAVNTYNTAEQPWQIEERIAARQLVSPSAPRSILIPQVIQPYEGPCSGAKGCDVEVLSIVNVLDEQDSAGEASWTGFYEMTLRFTPLDQGKPYEEKSVWMITVGPGDPRPVGAQEMGDTPAPQD